MYQFHTEDTLYYKTEIASNLDRDYGDIHAIIADIQDSILHTLAKKLASLSTALCDVAGTVAEILVKEGETVKGGQLLLTIK